MGIIAVSGLRTILLCGYYCQTINKDSFDFAKSCVCCKRKGGISKRQDLSMNQIMVIELFDVWSIDFMGSIVSSYGIKYILVVVDYV